jgi:hypothetical protein
MNPHEQLEIGQVIYCIAADTGAVYPVQIAEEVVHKSLSGTKKTYIVRLDLFDEQGGVQVSLMKLDELGDQWFPSLAMAKEFLLARFNEVVTDLIAKAEQLSQISFTAPVPETTVQPNIAQSQIVTQPTAKQPAPATQIAKKKPTVTLLDGTVVNLTIDEMNP